jgi:hypothetical protein
MNARKRWLLSDVRLFVAFALIVLTCPVALRAGAETIAHVRSTSAVLREVLDDGMWQSPTFNDIVKKIGRSDGIVYVEEGICRHGVHTCLLLDVTVAGDFRILRILVDLQGVLAHHKRSDLIASVGHELRHAMEVLAEPEIRSAAAAFLFYDRQSPTTSPTFETDAAIQAGLRIRQEVGQRVLFVWQQVALDPPH